MTTPLDAEFEAVTAAGVEFNLALDKLAEALRALSDKAQHVDLSADDRAYLTHARKVMSEQATIAKRRLMHEAELCAAWVKVP